jgi:hypothetical protein
MWSAIIASNRLRNKPSIGILQVKAFNNILLGGSVNYTFSFDNPPNPNSKVLIFIGSDLGGRTATIPNTLILLNTVGAPTGRVFQPNTPLQTYTMTTSTNGRFWIYMLELENCDVISGIGFTPSLVTNTITSVSSNVLKDDTLITIYNSAPTSKPSIVANNGFNIITPTSDFVVEGFIRLYDNEFLNQTTDLSYTQSATAIRLFTVRLMKNYTQFLPETQAIVNRAILEGFTLPDQFKLNCIDRLIREMKLSGYWQKRDLILNYAYNDDNVEDFTRINWKNPTGALSTYLRDNRINILGDTNSLTNFWSNVSSTRVTGQLDPLGGNQAILITTTGASNRYAQNLGNNLQPGKIYNISVYAKFSIGNSFRLQNGSASSESATFNLQTGTTTSTAGTFSNAQIENVGNGWYRCSASFQATSNIIGFAISGTGSEYFIWGGQLTLGSSLQTYSENTNREGVLIYSNEGSIGCFRNVDNYIQTNWNLLNDSNTYLLNNASRDVVIYKPSPNTGNVISGILSGGQERWGVINATANIRINQGGTNLTGGSADLRNEGYKSINRLSSNDLTFFNKDVTFDRTAASQNLINDSITVHRASGVVGDNVISYFSLGASTVAEAQNFRTAYNNYLTSIGLSPIA